MKSFSKFFSIIGLLLLLSETLGNLSPALAYTEKLDQFSHGDCCDVNDLASPKNFPIYQHFTPQVDRLTKVKIEFSKEDYFVPYTIYIRNENYERIASATIPKIEEYLGKKEFDTFTFDKPVEVIPGKLYKIEFTEAPGSPLGLRWSTTAKYPGGYAQITGREHYASLRDFHFETYGYNTNGSPIAQPTKLIPTLSPSKAPNQKDNQQPTIPSKPSASSSSKGIVLGGLVGIGIIGALIFLITKKRK